MCKQSDEYYVLDRIENGVCILISDRGEEITARDMAGREGDIFRLEGGVFIPDEEEKAKRSRRIKSKMDSLFSKD